MAFFKEELKNIKGFIFDIDGVLSKDYSTLNSDGEPMRTANLKDGYAIRNAITNNFPVCIISGGRNISVGKRYEKLGVEHIYMNALDKIAAYEEFLSKTGLKPEEILYMGDDLPDHMIMTMVGVPVCPIDAVAEIKEISKYISDKKGGEGCVRDVIEQVMKSQGCWLNVGALHQSAFNK